MTDLNKEDQDDINKDITFYAWWSCNDIDEEDDEMFDVAKKAFKAACAYKQKRITALEGAVVNRNSLLDDAIWELELLIDGEDCDHENEICFCGCFNLIKKIKEATKSQQVEAELPGETGRCSQISDIQEESLSNACLKPLDLSKEGAHNPKGSSFPRGKIDTSGRCPECRGTGRDIEDNFDQCNSCPLFGEDFTQCAECNPLACTSCNGTGRLRPKETEACEWVYDGRGNLLNHKHGILFPVSYMTYCPDCGKPIHISEGYGDSTSKNTNLNPDNVDKYKP